MSFRQDVEGSHRTTFANTVVQVMNQNPGRIRAMTQVVNCEGDSRNVADLLDDKEPSEAEDYSMTNPNNRSKLDPVWLLRPKVIESGEYIYKEDKWDMAMDPTSNFTASHVRAVRKGEFDRILGIRKVQGENRWVVNGNGIMGRRITGKGKTGAALPAGNTIPHDGEGMTLTRLNTLVLNFGLEDIGLEEDMTNQICAVLSPFQRRDLLQIAIQTETQLNAYQVDQIKNARPTSLFGIDWMFSNRVPKEGTVRKCPFWRKAGIVTGIWEEFYGDLWNDTSAKRRPYTYVGGALDATRIEDKDVQIMECEEGV
ncbi:MAG: phage capsid protein [Pseudomonadota bacterium]